MIINIIFASQRIFSQSKEKKITKGKKMLQKLQFNFSSVDMVIEKIVFEHQIENRLIFT